MVTINTQNENILDKESKVNINMRVKESLKNKIKDTMLSESKSPDELFSEMFQAYLKEQAENKGEADYTNDIAELKNVVNRTVTIFKNMIEKTYMQNAIVKDNFSSEIQLVKESLTSDYEKKLISLQKECDKVKREYELITEQAEALLKDTRELKETSSILKNTNEKNEELLKTYKEQIEALKSSNIELQSKLKNSIDTSILEKAEISKERALLEKDKHYQDIINSMQEKYNELQTKYTKLLEGSFSKDK